MRRRLLNLLTVLSPLLCCAVVVVWVRSYSVVDVLKLGTSRLYQAASGGGGVMLLSLDCSRREGNWHTGLNQTADQLATYTETPQEYIGAPIGTPGGPGRRWEWTCYSYADRNSFWERAWAGVAEPKWPHVVHVAKKDETIVTPFGRWAERWFTGRALWLPYWLGVAAFGALPSVRLWKRATRRKREDRCRQCAYNLTGNLSGVCPECGTPAPTPSLAGGLARRSATHEVS